MNIYIATLLICVWYFLFTTWNFTSTSLSLSLFDKVNDKSCSSLSISIPWNLRPCLRAHRRRLIRTNFRRNGTQLTSIWQRERASQKYYLATTTFRSDGRKESWLDVAVGGIVHLERLTNAAGNTFGQEEGKWRFIATRAISTVGNRSKVGPTDGQGPSH